MCKRGLSPSCADVQPAAACLQVDILQAHNVAWVDARLRVLRKRCGRLCQVREELQVGRLPQAAHARRGNFPAKLCMQRCAEAVQVQEGPPLRNPWR
jgi:hypothetical protein